MKKMMKKIIYLVVVLLVLASVNAEIKVTKKLSDTDIACGDCEWTELWTSVHGYRGGSQIPGNREAGMLRDPGRV